MIGNRVRSHVSWLLFGLSLMALAVVGAHASAQPKVPVLTDSAASAPDAPAATAAGSPPPAPTVTPAPLPPAPASSTNTVVPPAPAPGPAENWPGLVALYVLVLVAFPLLLMGADVIGAYRAADKTREALLEKMSSERMSAEQVRMLSAQLGRPLGGISGLSRSTMALVFLLILGISVFHMLALNPEHAHESLDKVLTLLTGAVTSIIGFYFGGKAATDAKEPPLPPKPPLKEPGSIAGVEPKTAAPPSLVTISGKGFGSQGGSVLFNKVTAKTPTSWADDAIKVEVPQAPELPANTKVRLTVNPAGGAAIESAADVFVMGV